MIVNIYFLLIFIISAESLSFDIWSKPKFKNILILKDFWKNTGLCPASNVEQRAEFLLSDDEKFNIDLIGALPNRAINMIRIHWLLDLVRIEKEESNVLTYNFDSLDRLIEHLHRNQLHPSFELMGNPSNYFYDFKKQSREWSNLIKEIISRYSYKYGVTYVRNWRFELTNEPDLKLYNAFNFTLENYIDYFRATESAVRVVGPAGLFRDNRKVHLLCWGLLNYCNLNPCNLDMITFHRKGNGYGSQVVEDGLELINSLLLNYPNLKRIPFGNDEADIMTGWSKPLLWRADVRYAALVVQVIIGHIKEMMVKRNLPFEMLSNDNAFLSFSPHYFTQRTLLARFQINNTSPPHVQFFRKPIYSTMGLLSLLGNFLIDIQYKPGRIGLSYLVTNNAFQTTLLGVVTNDKALNESYTVHFSNSVDVRVKLTLRNSNRPGKCVGYIMNNLKNNPFKIWEDNGSPDFPDSNLRRKMRKAEGFKRLFIKKIDSSDIYAKYVFKNVFVPSVFAMNICFEGTEKPGIVSDLRYVPICENEILLLWKDTFINSRCILTYIVEFRQNEKEAFNRINEEDTIFLSYHFDGKKINGTAKVKGDYRVAAIDYWKRKSSYSNIITVSTRD